MGNFDALYKENADPWGQSGIGSNSMSAFYSITRSNLVRFIELNTESWESMCEVGCGTGHLTNILQGAFPGRTISGCDISDAAIKIARTKYVEIKFEQLDILTRALTPKTNILILSNILWYVIHDIDALTVNSLNSLCASTADGKSYLIVQNALFKAEQNYAADIVRSAGTLIDLFFEKITSIYSGEIEIRMNNVRKKSMEHDHIIMMMILD